MTVRRERVVILNIPIEVLARNVSEVLRGNPFYKSLHVSEDRQEFTFTTGHTILALPLNWRIQLSSKETQTVLTVEYTSLPIVQRDGPNNQNRFISHFLTSLQRVSDQTLLRAAAAPTTTSETLLRATGIGAATASEELLRPDPHNTEV